MFQRLAFGYGVPDDPEKVLVTTSEQLESMLAQLRSKSLRCFDHETTGLAWYRESRSCGLALGCFGDNGRAQAWYVPYRHETGERQLDIERVSPAFRELFADPYATWVAHNFKFDEHMNRKEGWHIDGRRYCTQLAARLWDENALLALKYRAIRDLNREYADEWETKVTQEVVRMAKARKMRKTEYLSQFGYSEVPTDLLGYYACHDIDFALGLYGRYEGWGLSQKFGGVFQTEMELLSVLCDVEEWGLPIDGEYLETLRESLYRRMDEINGELEKRLGVVAFDPGNDDQLRAFLYERLCLPWAKRTSKGNKLSVDHEVLGWFIDKHPTIPLIAEYRDAKKIVTTWTTSLLAKLDAQGVLHGELRSDGTATGRLSSEKPNLQNFAHDSDVRAESNHGVDPWSIRRAFVMRDGMDRVYFDQSQVELRTIAFYTGDPIMVRTYMEGGDIHARTQEEIGAVLGGGPIKRRPAKVINFGISYGLSSQGLSRNAKISERESELFMNAFLQRYHRVVQYRQWFWHRMRVQGCQFLNMYGRPRRIPDLSSDVGWVRKRAERQAFGSLIQGTAADLMKRTMVRLARWIRSENLPIRLCGNVHDEVWMDLPRGMAPSVVPRIREIMEYAPEFHPIPIVVDGKISSSNWAEKTAL